MSEYKTEILEIVNNPNYIYYKLYVDGKCAFDEFLKEVSRNVADRKNLEGIIAYMDFLNAQLLHNTIYNHIQDNERTDLYEFKKKNLRVYVIDQRPEIFVVMGGYKVNQQKDIAKLKNKVKDFPQKTNLK